MVQSSKQVLDLVEQLGIERVKQAVLIDQGDGDEMLLEFESGWKSLAAYKTATGIYFEVNDVPAKLLAAEGLLF